MTAFPPNRTPSSPFASRRLRLIALLGVATIAITVLAFRAGGDALSYYITPEEYLANPALEGTRVRVAGRVVEGSIEQRAGRPVAFDIYGDVGDVVAVRFEQGIVPNMFGPYAMVVVEGTGQAGGVVRADKVIIKHEDEFFADVPPGDSISSHFVPDARD